MRPFLETFVKTYTLREAEKLEILREKKKTEDGTEPYKFLLKTHIKV